MKVKFSDESVVPEKKHFLEPFGIHKVKCLDYQVVETSAGDKYRLVIYLTNGDEGKRETELPSGEKTTYFITRTNVTSWINEDYLTNLANTFKAILMKLGHYDEKQVEEFFEKYDSYIYIMKAVGELFKSLDWFYIHHKVNYFNGYWNAELAGIPYKDGGVKANLCLPEDLIKGSIQYSSFKNKKGYDSEVISSLKYRFKNKETEMKVSEEHDFKDVVRDDEQDDDNEDLGLETESDEDDLNL